MNLPIRYLLTCLSTLSLATAAATAENIPLQLPSGRELRAQLVIPESRTGPQRLPVLLVFGGFQNAGRVLELVRTRTPIVLASFDYPFAPPRKFRFPEGLRAAPQAKAMIDDTLSGIQALTSAVKQRPDVDPERIGILGASLGAPFAIEAASRNAGFHSVILVHGFGDIPATATHQLVRAWEPRFGMLASPLAWFLAHAGWLYFGAHDPDAAARAFPANQNVLLISASEDRFIPESVRESLWRSVQASPASSQRIVMPGDHLQPGSDELIARIMGKVEAWAERTGFVAGKKAPIRPN